MSGLAVASAADAKPHLGDKAPPPPIELSAARARPSGPSYWDFTPVRDQLQWSMLERQIHHSDSTKSP